MKLTVKQAALVIGCSTTHCRKLVREGILKGTKVTVVYGQIEAPNGYYWVVSQEEAERYRDRVKKSTNTHGGFPLGKKRRSDKTLVGSRLKKNRPQK